MRNIAALSLSLLLLAFTGAFAQETKKSIEPGCHDQKSGCATICLTEDQYKQIAAHRQKQGKNPFWRPSICDGKTYGTGGCEDADWSTTDNPACAKACNLKRIGAYAVYNKSLWPKWGNSYACEIK